MGDVQEIGKAELLKHSMKRIISRVSHIDEADLQDHLLVREELGVDSLTGMEIVYSCEKLLGIHVDEALFADVQTVNDFLVLLMKISGASHSVSFAYATDS